jgi:hypothetical protein
MVVPVAVCHNELAPDFCCLIRSALEHLLIIRFKIIEMLKEYEMGPFQVCTAQSLKLSLAALLLLCW